MTNVKEFHSHMRMNLQPYEENRICLALFHGTGENYNLALLNTEQDMVHKMDFTGIVDFIHSCSKNQEETVLSVLF